MVNDCIVVMGKRPATEIAPFELMARAAFASIQWHLMEKKGLIFCVEGFDIIASSHSGSEIVKEIAIEKGGIPEEYTFVSSLTNCTSREVLAIKDVLNTRHLHYPMVVTHPYHVRRVKKYLTQVDIKAAVVACSYQSLMSSDLINRYHELAHIVKDGEPDKLNLVKENLAETILSTIHFFDADGKFERYLSDRIRGDGLSVK